MTIPVPNQGEAHAGQGSIEDGYLYVEASDNYLNIGLYGEGRGTFTLAESSYVTFIINRPASMPSDGKGPQVASQPAPMGTNTSYLTQNNKGDLFDASGSVAGNINAVTQTSIWNGIDTVDLTGVAVRKSSLNVTEVGGVSGSFAKKVQLNINEINTDGGNASVTQATYYAGLAGITVGSITQQTATIYNSSFTHGAFTYSATEGTGKGYYHWKVNDQGRTSGVLTLYFNDNVSNLKVRVYDSGNNYLEITVNVGVYDGRQQRQVAVELGLRPLAEFHQCGCGRVRAGVVLCREEV